jgi:hypothetical protein
VVSLQERLKIKAAVFVVLKNPDLGWNKQCSKRTQL